MIAILVYPDFQLLDATGPAAVFEVARRYVPSAPDIKMIAVKGGIVRSSSKVEVVAAELPPAVEVSTLIVVGALEIEEVIKCQSTIAYVRQLASVGVRIASVCSGAYVLAEAGLLDARKATTHWCRTQDFVVRYPNVRLDPERIYLNDGNIWTSGGVTAGIDLALAITSHDHGDDIAKEVARQLVVYHRRGGGQSQFSSLLELKSPDGRFGPLLSWVRENLDNALTVENLADRAGLSPRHFARVFTAETGATPSKAVERLRLEVARERVQTTSEQIEQVAESTGFGDAERMRRAFVRAFGQPPQSLRRVARNKVTHY
jgi:transcriptional regulator GlxA family with amidase domain